MAMSAAVSHSLALSARDTLPSLRPLRSLSLSSSTSSLTLGFNFTKSLVTPKSPGFIPLAVSMRTRAPEQVSPLSFLDRREREFLYFVKYHALGNDFILVDNRDSSQPKVSPGQAIKLCDRNFGIGTDGVIFAMPGINGTDYTMRIFNSDGSEPEMCGNGIRCFARFIAELKNLQGKQSFKVHTGAGLIIPEIQEDGKVKVDMGEPIFKASEAPTRPPANKGKLLLSMGNPHCVIFEIGPKFEHHSMFPARINTEFVQVYSSSHLKMRVWERGAVNACYECGSGLEEDNRIYMTGPAEAVVYGSVPL
ncbi:hypothetical protein K2173_001859 [Erythroxylum novogranatense]|uniref:diaminopimelate epimerase n=1 Tax=Erythroxylum novogranatense TaxID=1862640 RepID=A0AAV8SPM2_9ROSI|nr:hypothetical protein K2173_001859 [Erythroxylum novogranatense]